MSVNEDPNVAGPTVSSGEPDAPSGEPSAASSGTFSESLSQGLSELQGNTEPGLAPEAGGSADPGGVVGAPPPSPSLREQLEAYGFSGVQSDAEAQQRLLEAWQVEQQQREALASDLQRYQQLAQYGNTFLQLQQDREFQEWFNARRNPQRAQQQAPQQTKWWSPPDVNEQVARRYLTTDPETGQTTWKPDTPLEVRQAYEQRQTYIEDWSRDLLYNPVKAAEKFWEGEFKTRVEQLLAEREQQYQQQAAQQRAVSYAQQIQQQNQQWIYARDPVSGAPMVDPRTGQYVPTPQGAAVLNNLSLLDRAIAGDPSARWEFALKATLGEMQASGQQAQQASPQQIAEQKKQEFLQRTNGAGHIAPRGGSLAPSPAPQNQHQSFAESLRQSAIQSGLDLNRVNP